LNTGRVSNTVRGFYIIVLIEAGGHLFEEIRYIVTQHISCNYNVGLSLTDDYSSVSVNIQHP